MNVLLAFQLLPKPVSTAMEALKDDPRYLELNNSLPTIQLIEMVDNLIHAMTSRTSWDALYGGDSCTATKAIKDFLEFFGKWENFAKSNNVPFPVSSSTLTGLKVRLRSTLELLEFPQRNCDFQYLMSRQS
ncbi:uncharacterized protein [Venturia canescens]|uniref:uncharacterized protein n=1 Tax=Venturia canescens TaxID=32260 RepID=UPI001C9C78D4|nr:uncharacterized protein LOC122406925 [Venturia canescens]